MERAYRNLGYFLLALPLIMMAGFWIPYFSEFPHFDKDITPSVHMHAVALFSWVALLVIQPLAIRGTAFATHRFLGHVSYFLMPLIVLSALAMLRKEYHEHLLDGLSPAAALKAEYLSIGALLLLAGFYLAAIARILKRDSAAHMRYMLCTAIAVLPAGLARVMGYWFGVRQAASQTACLLVIDAGLCALIMLDRHRRSDPRPYAVALVAYLAFEAGWVALGRPL